MKITHRTFILLSALAASAASYGCGSRVSDSVTETGNPPFVDRERVMIESDGEEATVTGHPGAVDSGASVSVENERTGAKKTTKAKADGSFELTIEAEAGDSLSVSIAGEGTESFTVSAAAGDTDTQSDDPGNGGDETTATESEGSSSDHTASTSDDGSNGEGQMCEAQLTQLQRATTNFLDGVDRTCSSDDDCVDANVAFDCYNWGCGQVDSVSVAGKAELTSRGAAIDAQCEALLASDCSAPPIPPCVPPPDWLPSCMEGQCTTTPGTLVPPCDESDLALTSLKDTLFDGVDRSCEQDDECALAPVDLSCGWNFDSQAVSSSEVAGIEARQDEVSAACDEYFATCPSIPRVAPNDAPIGAVCRANTCEAIPADCDAQITLIDATLAAEVGDVQECAVDADCVALSHPLSCGGPSCTLFSIASAQQESFAVRMDELEQTLCEPFTETTGCERPIPPCPEQPDPDAVCTAGKCAFGSASLDEGACQDLVEQAHTNMLDFANATDKTCSVDDDCEVYSVVTDCIIGCAQTAVAKSSIESIEAQREQVDDSVCADHAAGQCVAVDASCPPVVLFPNGVGCVEGQCAAKP